MKPHLALEDFIARRTLVRVVRSALEPIGEHLRGVPVAVGKRWVVLARLTDSIELDGFDALRVADSTRLPARFPHRAFLIRALRRRRTALRALPRLQLDTTQGLLRSAQGWFSLLTIERELVNPGAAEIGVLAQASSATYRLRLIDLDARMERQNDRFRTRDVTRVAFGGSYENALADAAEIGDRQWR